MMMERDYKVSKRIKPQTSPAVEAFIKEHGVRRAVNTGRHCRSNLLSKHVRNGKKEKTPSLAGNGV